MYKVFTFSVLCGLLMNFLTACSLPEVIKDGRLIADQLKQDGLATSHWHETKEFKLHYVRAGLREGPIFVFVHGTPGDWRIFGPLLAAEKLLTTAQLIALDRPGWGASSLPDGGVKVSLADQAGLIQPLLTYLRQSNPSQPIILVGHSLGASLVPRVAMDFSTLVDGVVVIAGDLSPAYFPARWYNYAANWLLVSWLLPNEMRKANREVMGLERELELMKSQWGKLSIPLVVVQGMKDGLVDPRNADFIEQVVPATQLSVKRIDDAGHLLHLTDTAEIVSILEGVLQSMSYKISSL